MKIEFGFFFFSIGDGVNLTNFVINLLAVPAEEGGYAPACLCTSWHCLILLFWASRAALALLLFYHDILSLLIQFSTVY